VFNADVAKVDRNVAHVAIMVVHICCKLLLPMFYLFFPDICCKYVYLDVSYVSHICCKCFSWMLRMFYNGSQVFFMCFCKCFRCIFQMFDLPSNVCCKCCIWMF
jgi:hypothetical protein